MSAILAFLSEINPIVLGGMAGALGGAVGVLAGRWAKQFIKWPHTELVVTIFLMIVLPKLVVDLVEARDRSPSIEAVMKEVKKQDIFQALIESYPDSEAEFRAALQPILNEKPKDISARVEVASRLIVSRYVEKSIATASDGALAELLALNALTMSRLAAEPKLCVDYYLGRGSIGQSGNFSWEDLLREARVKASLLRTAVKSPSRPAVYWTMEEIGTELVKRYGDLKLDVQGLAKLEKVAELDPVEGCRIATDFAKALAGSDDKSSALLMKSLMKLDQAQ